MKAFDIIDELTRNSYENNNGTFTADEATSIYSCLQWMFGKNFEVFTTRGTP